MIGLTNEFKGKRLAMPYARAVLSMLPTTLISPSRPMPHESINDLPVHKDTVRQLFLPVSESRHFTRVDAGKAFSPTLLPADDRIPHPELVQLERDRNSDMTSQERIAKQRKKLLAEKQEREEREEARKAKEKRELTRVTPPQGRWEFRFRDVSVESVGKDGRDRRGVGARYGMPHEDRKRGQIKIPTRVE